jgi:hypothetical protein
MMVMGKGWWEDRPKKGVLERKRKSLEEGKGDVKHFSRAHKHNARIGAIKVLK